MVAADERRRCWCLELASVVAVERAELLVLWRTRHALEIAHVAYGLKVTAYDKQVRQLLGSALQLTVHTANLIVAAALDRDLRRSVVFLYVSSRSVHA